MLLLHRIFISSVLLIGASVVSFHSISDRPLQVRSLSLGLYSSIPSNYDSVENECVSTLVRYIQSSPEERRLAIDVLTPGLNPKLEQKAVMLQDYIFALVVSLLPGLSTRFSHINLLFQSIGDAASFQKYQRRMGFALPINTKLSDVSIKSVSSSDDCALFITTKNHIGDPVLSIVQSFCDTYPDLTAVFLNCDLSDKVTTGMQQKNIRDAFRASIRPVYYFRNIVQFSRPSMIPCELGVLRYIPGTGWEIFVILEDDVQAEGSLNRFMKQGAFARSIASEGRNQDSIYQNSGSKDKTLVPPRFVLAKSYAGLIPPDRDALDSTVSGALARLERERSNSPKESFPTVLSNQDPRQLLYEYVRGKVSSSQIEAFNIISALKKLCVNSSTPVFVPVLPKASVRVESSGRLSLLDDQPESMADVVQVPLGSLAISRASSGVMIQSLIDVDWEMVIQISSKHVQSVQTYLSTPTLLDTTLEIRTLNTRTVIRLFKDCQLEQNQYMRMWPLSSFLLSSDKGSYRINVSSDESSTNLPKETTEEDSLTMTLCCGKGEAQSEQCINWLLVLPLDDPTSGGEAVTVALSHELNDDNTHIYKLWKKASK